MEGREKQKRGASKGKDEPKASDPLVRIADALEKLAADPEVEIEAGPPVCPTCGKHDPEILLAAQEQARGPMSQLIIDGACGECGNAIYIVIESYSVHRSSRTATEEIKERERVGFFNEVR